MTTDTKVCKGCGTLRSLDDFHRHPTTRDGRVGKCKICKAEGAAARRQAFIDEHGEEAWLAKQRAASAAHRARHPGDAAKRNQPRNAAISELIARHRVEFDALVRLAKEGKL